MLGHLSATSAGEINPVSMPNALHDNKSYYEISLMNKLNEFVG